MMTPEEFKEAMVKCVVRNIQGTNIADIEGRHRQADEYMLEILEGLGYEEGCNLFRRMAKWYS